MVVVEVEIEIEAGEMGKVGIELDGECQSEYARGQIHSKVFFYFNWNNELEAPSH